MNYMKKSNRPCFKISKYFLIDIICNERFVCTMRVENVPQYRDVEKLTDHIIERMPSLKNKEFEIHYYE